MAGLCELAPKLENKTKNQQAPHVCWWTWESNSKSDTNKKSGGKTYKAFEVCLWFYESEGISVQYLVPVDLSSILSCECLMCQRRHRNLTLSLCSLAKIIHSVKATTYWDGGSFNLQTRSEPMAFPLPKLKAGQCFCSGKPLHCLLSQMNYIIQLWSEEMLLLEPQDCSPRTNVLFCCLQCTLTTILVYSMLLFRSVGLWTWPRLF